MKIKKLLETKKSWDGENFPALQIKNPKVTVLKISIPEGFILPMHKHPIINVGYILKGTLSVYKENGEKMTLTAGQSAAEMIDQWHYGENTGKEKVELVLFCIGNEDQPLTILKKDN